MSRPPAVELMTPQEVSQLFRCDAKTVSRWAQAGKLTALRTIGNHRRFFAAEVRGLLLGEPLTPAEIEALRAQLGGRS